MTDSTPLAIGQAVIHVPSGAATIIVGICGDGREYDVILPWRQSDPAPRGALSCWGNGHAYVRAPGGDIAPAPLTSPLSSPQGA